MREFETQFDFATRHFGMDDFMSPLKNVLHRQFVLLKYASKLNLKGDWQKCRKFDHRAPDQLFNSQ